LKSLVEHLDPHYRNAIEFRHRSWWRAAVSRRFRERGLIFCSVSGPRLPDELITTGEILYLRFHGRSRWYRYNYSPNELADWAAKIAANGAREAWIYFNNDREGHAIENARELRALLSNGPAEARSSG
jgi:uncharacterized protein YecE (DUF72 family)